MRTSTLATPIAAALLCLPFLGCSSPRTAFGPGEAVVLQAADGTALGGYDPVSYFGDDGPAKGVPELAATHAGATYRFASEANRDAFTADPERYAPAYGGWCAWAIADGDGSLVEIDPRSFLIQDGRLLLFYDGWLADTRKMWLDKDTAELAGSADANWTRLEETAR